MTFVNIMSALLSSPHAGATAACGLTSKITEQFLLAHITLLNNLTLKRITVAALLCFYLACKPVRRHYQGIVKLLQL